MVRSRPGGRAAAAAVANLMCSFGGIPIAFHLLRSRERVWQALDGTEDKNLRIPHPHRGRYP